MVRTRVQTRKKKKRKTFDTSAPVAKKHSPGDPDVNKFYSIKQVPKFVEDPAEECLMHTTQVIRTRLARREQRILDGLGATSGT